MVRDQRNRVTLTAGDYIKLAAILFTNLMSIATVGILMWTKLAVVEQQVQYNQRQIEKVESAVEMIRRGNRPNLQ